MKKQIAAALLALCLVLSIMPVQVGAANIANGNCGINLKWTLDSSGVLTISGTGSMDSSPYWKGKDTSITSVVIPFGVSNVGQSAFSGCSNLKKLTIPYNISIEKNAFWKCPLTDIYYGGSRLQWRAKLSSWGIQTGITDNSPTVHYSKYDITLDKDPRSGECTVYGEGTYSLNESCTVRASAASKYKFQAWMEGSKSVSTSTSYTFTVTKDRDLVAKFYPPCVVTFDSNGGSIMAWESPVEVEYGNKVPAFRKIYRDGYTFDGWYSDAAYQNKWDFSTNIVTSNITLYAKWIEDPPPLPPPQYTVTFDPNGGTVTPTSMITGTDGKLASLPIPTHDDCHTYNGWYQFTGTGFVISANTDTVFTQDTTIYAKWSENHNWSVEKEEITRTPTCTTEGKKTVTEMCTDCKQTKTRTETLGMVDHTWREEIIIEKEPTCTTAGAQYIRRTCTVCNSMVALPGEPIPATGIHTLEPIPGKAATCTEDGYTEGSVCSVCGAVLKKTETINALAHAWGDEKESVTKPATCTETGIMTYTKVCQRPGCSAESTRTEDIAILNHQWGAEDAGVVKKPATCTEKGIRTYTKTCAVCHTEEHRDEDINPNGHTEADILAVSPTCTTDGKTAGKECSVCHTLLEAPQTIPAAHTNVVKIPGKDADCENKGLTEGKKCTACGTIIEAQIETGPLGHDWNGGGVETVIKQPTCKEEGEKRIEGAVCTRCNASKAAVTQTIPKTAHTDIEEISGKAASCEETGLTSGKRCRTCGDILEEQTTISALGHDWVEDGNSTETVTKAPTCTAAGEKIITGGVKCSRCPATDSQSRTVSIQPNGHSFGTAAEEITKQPTCTEKGVKVLTKTCTVCGEKQTETKKLNPTGHTWGEWTTVKQPTATEAGSEKRLCSVCHEEETRVLPATGVTPGVDDKPSDNLRYRIFTPGSTYGGSFSVSHSSAVRGTRITIELDPWRDFESDRLSVTNLNTGREVRLTQHYSDTYTFTMPAGDVELDLSYANTGSVDTYFILPDPPVKTGPNAWYYRDRHIYHATNGLVPDRTPITRDMLISVLYNLTDWSTSTTIGCETNDSQVWATNYHIVPDIHDSGLSGFDKSLNREQASVLIFRYAGYRGCNTSQRSDLTRYSDYTRVRSFARSAMSWALATELMKATTSSTLSPQADITCGETGTLLSHFLSGVVWMK